MQKGYCSEPTAAGGHFGGKEKKPAVQFELMKNLDIPDDVKALIYRGNANRLFGFK